MAKKSIWKRLKYKNIAVTLAALLIIILCISAACSSGKKTDDKNESEKKTTSSVKSTSKSTATKKEDEPKVVLSTETLGSDYKYIVLENETNISKGDLILVNGDYAYTGGEPSDMVSSYDYRTNQAGEKVMSIKDSNVCAKKDVLESLNSMLSDFYSQTGINDVMLVSGYRTEEYQQQLYEADLESTGLEYSTLVEKPGHSEHHSGYAVDFQLDQDDYPMFTGEGDYSWIVENCYKYGSPCTDHL